MMRTSSWIKERENIHRVEKNPKLNNHVTELKLSQYPDIKKTIYCVLNTNRAKPLMKTDIKKLNIDRHLHDNHKN